MPPRLAVHATALAKLRDSISRSNSMTKPRPVTITLTTCRRRIAANATRNPRLLYHGARCGRRYVSYLHGSSSQLTCRAWHRHAALSVSLHGQARLKATRCAQACPGEPRNRRAARIISKNASDRDLATCQGAVNQLPNRIYQLKSRRSGGTPAVILQHGQMPIKERSR